jgi:hypothetical protein
VTVEILSVPQVAVTVAPGIGCPPERTVPFCVSANASEAARETAINSGVVVRGNQVSFVFSRLAPAVTRNHALRNLLGPVL